MEIKDDTRITVYMKKKTPYECSWKQAAENLQASTMFDNQQIEQLRINLQRNGMAAIETRGEILGVITTESENGH